ncbi:hypothetical protein CCR95_04650 [Thiocystis minor]|uniref:glycosyltransferase n=1 Tax=Thiocystis minor TaxID=61597 RepID=UPI00191189A4|nr:glycosyltransferase [Thiocystis minor]MBK5963398.1 hypothetical protein [Thiocystis minor]
MSHSLSLLSHETRVHPARAKHWLDLATGAFAPDAELAVLRAVNALRTGDFSLAIARFLCAAQTLPEQSELIHALSQVLDRAGLPEAALEQWLKLVAADPRQPGPLEQALELTQRLGDLALPSAQGLCRAQLPHLRAHQRPALHRSVRALNEQHGTIGAVWLEERRLKGWALDQVYPTRRLEILVYLNGQTGPRLTPAGRFPVGRSFQFDLPAAVCEGGIVIDALTDTGARLAGAPLLLGAPPPSWIARSPGDPALRPGRGIDLVVPVYRDRASATRCLDSVLASRRCNRQHFRLVLINDCSPEPGMKTWLRSLAQDAHCVYLETPRNLGFIGAINLALAVCRCRNMVWLNSDTLVAGDWLDRLHAAAHCAADVATVTPLSNNAQLFSHPRVMADNPMPDAQGTAHLHRLAGIVNSGHYPSVPTGVGFCLYLKAEALAAAGPLDDRAYRLGYAEEVDYCLRLNAAGWRHLCATDVYVAHQGGVSFQADKTRLAKNNDMIIQQRYPQGRAEIGDFLRSDPLSAARARLERRWLTESNQWDGLFLFSAAAAQRFYVFDTLQRRHQSGARDLQLRCLKDEDGLVVRLEGTLDCPPCNLRYRLPLQQANLARAFQALRIDGTITVFHDREFPPVVFDLLASAPDTFDLICLDDSLARNSASLARLPANHVPRGHNRYRMARWTKRGWIRSPPIPLDHTADLRWGGATSSDPAWIVVPCQGFAAADHRRLLALVRINQSRVRWLALGELIDPPALLSTGRCEWLRNPSVESLLEQLTWIGCRGVLNLREPPGPDPSAFLISRRLGLPYVGLQVGDGVAYLTEPKTHGVPKGSTPEAFLNAILTLLAQDEEDGS